jgi:hypothetical protein
MTGVVNRNDARMGHPAPGGGSHLTAGQVTPFSSLSSPGSSGQVPRYLSSPLAGPTSPSCYTVESPSLFARTRSPHSPSTYALFRDDATDGRAAQDVMLRIGNHGELGGYSPLADASLASGQLPMAYSDNPVLLFDAHVSRPSLLASVQQTPPPGYCIMGDGQRGFADDLPSSVEDMSTFVFFGRCHGDQRECLFLLETFRAHQSV